MKYLDLRETKVNPSLITLSLAMAATSPAAPGIEGNLSNPASRVSSTENALSGFLIGKESQNGAPPAYLNYLFFDKEMNYKYGGYTQMTESAYEDGSNREHERLYREVVADEPGYYYIYLSNDSPTGSEAFFDDFSVQVSEGPLVQMTDYYPYGMVAENWVREGEQETLELFQGKTFDAQTGWNDFHARQYDPALGRWFAMDPQSQFASPYLAMGNNPVMMVDPDGEFVFTAILPGVGTIIDAALWGAVIGAGSSATVYATTTAISGNQWDWGQFGNSVALGAVSGAIGGGIGGAFTNSAFAQTAGFSLLNNTASTVAGTAIMGGDITGGTIIGGIAGGLVGTGLPQFTGVKGGALANLGAELGYEAVRGGITGAVTGGVSAAVDGRNIGVGIKQGALYGAVGGATMASLKIVALGHTIKLDQKELNLIYKELGTDFSNYPPPVFRRGWFAGAGITVGRNISHHRVDDEAPMMGPEGGRGGRAYNYSGFAHELKHYQQISQNGIGRFYGRIFGQYLRYGYWNSPFEASAYKFGSRMNNIFRRMYQNR